MCIRDRDKSQQSDADVQNETTPSEDTETQEEQTTPAEETEMCIRDRDWT